MDYAETFQQRNSDPVSLLKDLRRIFGSYLDEGEDAKVLRNNPKYTEQTKNSESEFLFGDDRSQLPKELAHYLNTRVPDDRVALEAAAEAMLASAESTIVSTSGRTVDVGSSAAARKLRQRGEYSLSEAIVLKLLAIHKRLEMKSPVVLFGETGIGKTRMVEYYASLQKELAYTYERGSYSPADHSYVLAIQKRRTRSDTLRLWLRGVRSRRLLVACRGGVSWEEGARTCVKFDCCA